MRHVNFLIDTMVGHHRILVVVVRQPLTVLMLSLIVLRLTDTFVVILHSMSAFMLVAAYLASRAYSMRSETPSAAIKIESLDWNRIIDWSII